MIRISPAHLLVLRDDETWLPETSGKLGGGTTRVRKYDSRQQGLEYTLKCLNVTNGRANLYEVGKFSYSADEVMLANAIWDPANIARLPHPTAPQLVMLKTAAGITGNGMFSLPRRPASFTSF